MRGGDEERGDGKDDMRVGEEERSRGEGGRRTFLVQQVLSRPASRVVMETAWKNP